MTEPELDLTAEDFVSVSWLYSLVLLNSTYLRNMLLQCSLVLGQLVDVIDDRMTESESDPQMDQEQEAQTPMVLTCFQLAKLVKH
jgi:hypothetical protein